MPKFHWYFNPLRAPDDGGTSAAAQAVPPAGAPAADAQPAQGQPAAPAPAPAVEGGDAPAGNGSLIPDGSGEEQPPAKEGEAAPEGEALKVEDLKLPEGMTTEDPALKGLLETLGNKDLKPTERAQAILDAYKGQVGSVVEQVQAATQAKMAADYRAINDGWVAEVKADPVISKPEAQAVVAKALDTYGDGKELRKVFALTGAGNNPHVIRLLHTMASALGEGRPAQGGAATPTKSAADVFYPSAPQA